MKTRTRQVPATTNNITRGIINFLNSKGHFAFRVNTQGTFNPIAGSFRRIAPNDKGCPDILCCMKYEPWGHQDGPNRGEFLCIEVKNKNTRDRISEDQKIFHDKIKKSKGRILIVTEMWDFLEWYYTSIFYDQFQDPEFYIWYLNWCIRHKKSLRKF